MDIFTIAFPATAPWFLEMNGTMKLMIVIAGMVPWVLFIRVYGELAIAHYLDYIFEEPNKRVKKTLAYNKVKLESLKVNEEDRYSSFSIILFLFLFAVLLSMGFMLLYPAIIALLK